MIIKCIMPLSMLMYTGQCVSLSHESNSQHLQIEFARSHNQLPGIKSGQMSFFLHCALCSIYVEVQRYLIVVLQF